MTAQLWELAEDNAVNCRLCAHACKIAEGKNGICGVRVNKKGKLFSVVEDVVTAVQMDPVEKKPLYHFLPGTKTFSIGSAGCNFRCRFCQNSEISSVTPKSTLMGRRLTPESIVRAAEENDAPSISFTYNEPTVFFELMYASAGLARANGMRTIMVSNGFMSPEFLQSMAKRIDAANIDLKAYSEDFYRKLCGGRLHPVLDNLKRIRDMGWWLEVTTLVIPGLNDRPEELEGIAAFIRDNLGKDTPWHISAFHGAHLMREHPATPIKTLETAWNIGQSAGLNYVYLGNVLSALGSDTFCPQCGNTLIERRGFRSRKRFSGAECPKCQQKIAGVWS